MKEINDILQDVQSGLCETVKSQTKDIIEQKIAEIEKQVNELTAFKIQLREHLKKIEKSDIIVSKPDNCTCLSGDS